MILFDIFKKKHKGGNKMKINEYMSRFIKGAEVEKGDSFVILNEGEIRKSEGFDNEQLILLVDYKNSQREIFVNKTNCKKLSEVYGDDTKDWVGNVVNLEAQEIMVKGKKRMTFIMDPVVEVEEEEIPSPDDFDEEEELS